MLSNFFFTSKLPSDKVQEEEIYDIRYETNPKSMPLRYKQWEQLLQDVGIDKDEHLTKPSACLTTKDFCAQAAVLR